MQRWGFTALKQSGQDLMHSVIHGVMENEGCFLEWGHAGCKPNCMLPESLECHCGAKDLTKIQGVPSPLSVALKRSHYHIIEAKQAGRRAAMTGRKGLVLLS